MSMPKNIIAVLVAASMLVLYANPDCAAADRGERAINILFLIDISGSMTELLGGSVRKIDAAKQVLAETLSNMADDINLGLRVFGQNCHQSTLLVPIGQGNRQLILQQSQRLVPSGSTPLAYALTQTDADFGVLKGSRIVILITDGIETCGGNPCLAVRQLNGVGVKLKVDIVGLDLQNDRPAREQLNCIAEASGGRYYDASTAAELINHIKRSVDRAIFGDAPPDLH